MKWLHMYWCYTNTYTIGIISLVVDDSLPNHWRHFLLLFRFPLSGSQHCFQPSWRDISKWIHGELFHGYWSSPLEHIINDWSQRYSTTSFKKLTFPRFKYYFGPKNIFTWCLNQYIKIVKIRFLHTWGNPFSFAKLQKVYELFLNVLGTSYRISVINIVILYFNFLFSIIHLSYL